MTLNGGIFEISSSFGTVPLSVARQISLISTGGVNTINQTAGYTAITGVVSGNGSLLKNGAGTVILVNTANSYTGTTEVSAGTLLVDGSIASSPLVTVDNSATLGGSDCWRR